ncbi:MAG: 4Fe-4S binding protein, partial [Bdellovibrio bacteriovorus]
QGLLPLNLRDAILYPQLVPSLLRFMEGPAWGATGFLLVLAATLLFGRVYCSSLCPLGTLQDLVAWLAGRWHRHRNPKAVHYRYARPHTRLHHGMLLATLASALGGSLVLLTLLDPFSLFGRSAALLLQPAVAAGSNLAGRALESWGLYGLAPVSWRWAGAGVVAATTALLLLVLVLAARHGRIFCNSLCPVGALLALGSRVALLKIRIDRGRCNRCAQCSVVCKAQCIDLKHQRVDFARCVACFDCIPACPESGIRYGASWSAAPDPPAPPPPPRPDARRRLLLGGVLAWTAWLATGYRRVQASSLATEPPRNLKPSSIPVAKTQAVAPPGTGSSRRYNATCTACYLCVSACPTGVIQPALLAYGARGLLQPRLDFGSGFCTHACVRCGEVCPTGAIRRLGVEAKKRVRMGQVHLIEDNCVVVTDRTACGACAEHCPTRAVYMVPYPEGLGLKVPELDPEVCVGCGACELACPVWPHKAIYVNGEAEQGVAAAPRERIPEGPGASPSPQDNPSGFPF